MAFSRTTHANKSFLIFLLEAPFSSSLQILQMPQPAPARPIHPPVHPSILPKPSSNQGINKEKSPTVQIPSPSFAAYITRIFFGNPFPPNTRVSNPIIRSETQKPQTTSPSNWAWHGMACITHRSLIHSSTSTSPILPLPWTLLSLLFLLMLMKLSLFFTLPLRLAPPSVLFSLLPVSGLLF